MATDPPSTIGGTVDLGKGLFGYRKAEVQQMLADRDGMLAEAERRMRTSTARIAELEAVLAETDGRNVRLEGQLRALSARNAEVEKAAVRIKAEGERLAAWRKRVQAVVVPSAIEQFRLLIEEIPDRVQEALTPVALSGPALLARMDATARNLGEPTARRGLEQSDRSR